MAAALPPNLLYLAFRSFPRKSGDENQPIKNAER
jgi:hypothetical protein